MVCPELEKALKKYKRRKIIKRVLSGLLLTVCLLCSVAFGVWWEFADTFRNFDMVSSATMCWTDFTGTDEYVLYGMQERQVLFFTPTVLQGEVSLWLENEEGEQIAFLKDIFTSSEFFFIVEGSGTYTFHVEGENAYLELEMWVGEEPDA